jgi:hypothetical protein
VTRSDRSRSSIWAVAVAISCCCICLLVAMGIAGAKDPNVAEVRLAHGSIGGFRWAIFASREGPSGTPRRPCLTAVSGGGAGGSAGFTLCGSVNRERQVIVAKSDGVGSAQRTVLGMAFGVEVRSVRLWLDGRRVRRYRLKRLGVRQAAVAGLTRFRYAADAFAGSFCLRRFATYSASGEPLRVSSLMGCPR